MTTVRAELVEAVRAAPCSRCPPPTPFVLNLSKDRPTTSNLTPSLGPFALSLSKGESAY